MIVSAYQNNNFNKKSAQNEHVFQRGSFQLKTMRMRTLFVLLLVLLVLVACKDYTMQKGAEWLREPDIDDIHSEKYPDIPESDIYEVTASKLDMALIELQQTSISKLSPQRAIWYTGHYYTCPQGKQAYLVRAVYSHAGTGAFYLKRLEHDLFVGHGSLGRSTIYQKSALVVNFDYEPDQIYIRVMIAE